MPSPRSLLWLLAAAFLLLLSALPLGPLPPIGTLLDPLSGIWSVAYQGTPRPETRVTIPQLTSPVDVAVDRRGVPHIFATSDLDAWRTLGWLHARDRLFQLDLQSRATEGTLTEWVGAAALPLDREMRQLGLAPLADSLWRALDSTTLVHRALEAYAEGVNARISTLGPRDLPFEYHLLGIRPRPWRPAYTLYLAERMAYTLSWQDTDLQREALATVVGDRVAAALLPARAPIQEPIVPEIGRTPPPAIFDLPPPGTDPRRVRRSTNAVASDAMNDLQAGSNNWAIAPRRSADHHALLAGDPHLDLSLPSLWYEAHLVTHDGLDIYGATLPGAPAVLIGLTRGVAWSFTNSEGDFVDHYREVVDDPAHPTRYQVDGIWRPVMQHLERFRDRQGRLLATDTMYRTRRGPLTRYAGEWRSVRWTALEARDPIGSFLRVQRAGSVADFLAAHATLEAPAQNGVAADTGGHIGGLTAGRFPRRPDNDGGAIFDGLSSADDWTGDLPPMPRVVDPPRGSIYSANQQGVDPRMDAAYRGNAWAAPWRALRIAHLSAADSAVTLDAMRRWQVDPVSERATWWRGAIVAAVAGDSALAGPRALLAGWHEEYHPDSRGAALFEATMDELAPLTWDELAVNGRVVAWPSATVLAALRDRPDDIWWDRAATPAREDRDDILRLALAQAWAKLTAPARLGPDTTHWRWDSFRQAQIPHIAFLPGLGSGPLSVTGGNGTLSPLAGSGTHGASWRMVVDLAPRPIAWTTYPGGQSGNPASVRYDDRIQQWRTGGLDSARIPRSMAELGPEDRAELVHLSRGATRPPAMPSLPTWWLLTVVGAVIGVIAAKRGWSAGWGVLAGALIWGGMLFLTWEPVTSWRLATRLGALFGGTPGWGAVLLVPCWSAMLAGAWAKACKSMVGERSR